MPVLSFKDIEPFRQERDLRGFVDFLERADHELGEPSRFIRELDPSVEAHARKTAIKVGHELRESLGRAYRAKGQGKFPGPLPDDAQRFRAKLLGPGLRHAIQAVTVGSLAGAWGHTDNLHIFDACGGNGVLSSTIAEVRGKHPSSGVVVDREPENCLKFPIVRGVLGSSARIALHISDVAKHAIACNEPSICVAKHACGPAADTIVRNISSQAPDKRPNRTAILTCCHGNLPKGPHPRGVSRHTWDRLARLADIRPGFKGLPPEVDQLGRFAMQLVDTVRLRSLPEGLKGEVKVAFPPDLSYKNHALVISRV